MKLRAALRALVAIAIVASSVLTAATPAAALHGPERIVGKVTDAATGEALGNVCVVLGPSAARCWTATNSAGDYVIDLGETAPPGFNTDVQFFRTGYASVSRNVTVNNDSATTLNVTLTRNDGGGGAAPPADTPPNLVQRPPAAPTPPGFTVYLPNITRMLGGRFGWHTPFIIQNVGSVATNLSVKYYRFSDGSLVATRTATVQSGRSFVGSPNDEGDLPENAQFSVVITSTGAPVVAVVNEHQGQGAAAEALSYSGISVGSSKVYLPLVSKMAGGWLTTMIIQNLGVTSTTVTATFARIGATPGSAVISRAILPGRSQFIDPRSEANLVDGAEYAVTLTSEQPIGVVANAHNDLPGTAMPMGDSYNGVPAVSGTTTYLPYVAKNADGIGRTTRVVIQNAGIISAPPTITITPFGGGSSTVIPAPLIEPGASYAFTPAVADGEYSITISDGTFAALATTISPATAMFNTGSSTAANKLYMPNVTRTLSAGPPDPGWTTPILIHSTGATSATLSWYRFADGVLVATQNVPLVTGATTRVNPATVSGLSDNTQYAVVLSSSSNVVAIVTELNLSAGDNAMVYRAFLQP